MQKIKRRRYETRSSTSDSDPKDFLPQVIPIVNPIKGESMAASNSESQQIFLQAMGLIASEVIHYEPVLSEETAAIMSSALNHIMIQEEDLNDPFFTPEEWEKVQRNRKVLLDALLKERCYSQQYSIESVESVESGGGEGGEGGEENVDDIIKKYMETCQCECAAHNDDELFVVTSDLFEIVAPLTDDSGNTLAGCLLPVILKSAAMKNMKFSTTKAGSCDTVNYILQFPSGQVSMFTGWPDFTMMQHYSRVERRLGTDFFKTGKIRGVGKIQSPPGNSLETKMATVAQAGIYTIGQFSKLRQVKKKRKLASIVLFKDITAQVALATIDPAMATSEDSIGGVTYRIVDSLHGYRLYDATELSKFASVFIATLKDTLLD